VGDREANLRAAIAALGDASVRVTQVSSFYETEPVDFPGAGLVFELCGRRKNGGSGRWICCEPSAWEIELRMGSKKAGREKGPAADRYGHPTLRLGDD